MSAGYGPQKRRTDSSNFFDREGCMQELNELKFAFSAFAEQFVIDKNKGSLEAQNARQCNQGFRLRVNYLLDSFDYNDEQDVAKAVANKMTAGEKLGAP